MPSIGPHDVIRFGYLIRRGRMVRCTKKQIRELKTALRWKIPEAQRQRIQMVLRRESGMTQPAIAEAMGVSLSTVNRAHMAFDQDGITALKPKAIGGRQRENMTVAEEKALLERFAHAAGASELLNIHALCHAPLHPIALGSMPCGLDRNPMRPHFRG
jgi:Winged helix-turn helix